MNVTMQIPKKTSVYILSDSKKINRFSNIVTIRKNNCHRYIIPAFTSKISLQYVKEMTKHPYYIVNVNMSDLQMHVSKDTDVVIVNNIYCDTDTKKEICDYYLLEKEECHVSL